jgi:hypothetical protein
MRAHQENHRTSPVRGSGSNAPALIRVRRVLQSFVRMHDLFMVARYFRKKAKRFL